jgi:hypothetical protein
MSNAYNNQASNIPPKNTKMVVGTKVKTPYGIGTIMEIIHPTKGYDNVNTNVHPGIIATIMVPVPGKPPIVFQQTFNTVVFTSHVGGEATITDQYDNNL